MHKMKKTIIVLLAIALMAGGMHKVYIYFIYHKSLNFQGKFDVNILKKKKNIIPVAIIGSGPAGLTAATYAARSGIEAYYFEGNKPGGLLTETTEVENWPGEDIILGPVLIDKMKKKVEKLGVLSITDTIISIDADVWPYALQLESGEIVQALSVIVATGATPKKLGIPGESEYWGYGVTSCATCDAPFRKGQDVLVVGGGDSAIEEAIQLAPYASKVTIVVRKGSMRAAPRMQQRLQGYSNIFIEYNVELKEIMGEEFDAPGGVVKQITGVRIFNNKKNTEYIVPDIKGVFLAIGHTPNTQFIKNIVACDGNGYIKLNHGSQETSVPGIFAAGDVADHHYRQAITAAGFGCMALLESVEFLSAIGCNEKIMNGIESRLYLPPQQGVSLVQEVDNLLELQELLKANKDTTVVVDFYAHTCPSCLQMMPMYNSVSTELKGKSILLKVDIDKAQDIVEEFHVMKVPCLMSFSQSEPNKQIYKVLNRKELLSLAKS